jgi:hypothetical protein
MGVVVPLKIQRQTDFKMPTYKPTKSELAAIHKGEAEIARGKFVTLPDLVNELDCRRCKDGAKATRKSPR